MFSGGRSIRITTNKYSFAISKKKRKEIRFLIKNSETSANILLSFNFRSSTDVKNRRNRCPDIYPWMGVLLGNYEYNDYVVNAHTHTANNHNNNNNNNIDNNIDMKAF